MRGWHLEGLAVRPQHRMVGSDVETTIVPELLSISEYMRSTVRWIMLSNCQGPLSSAQRRSWNLPGDGHETCPVVAMRSAQRWSPPA